MPNRLIRWTSQNPEENHACSCGSVATKRSTQMALQQQQITVMKLIKNETNTYKLSQLEFVEHGSPLRYVPSMYPLV